MRCFTEAELARYVDLQIFIRNERKKAGLCNQPWYISHAETITQNIVGQILAFFILWAYGIDTHTAWSLQLTFFIVAYSRGYAIRRLFDSGIFTKVYNWWIARKQFHK